MKSKKGMEMAQLIGIILAVAFLIFMVYWFGGDLINAIERLLKRFGDLFV